MLKTNQRKNKYIEDKDIPRPLRPRIVSATRRGRLRKEFKVRDGLSTMPHSGANAVISSVSTSYNDDILALRADVLPVLQFRVKQRCSIELKTKKCQKTRMGFVN